MLESSQISSADKNLSKKKPFIKNEPNVWKNSKKHFWFKKKLEFPDKKALICSVFPHLTSRYDINNPKLHATLNGQDNVNRVEAIFGDIDSRKKYINEIVRGISRTAKANAIGENVEETQKSLIVGIGSVKGFGGCFVGNSVGGSDGGLTGEKFLSSRSGS
jgi:hypothetical protein